MTKTDELLREMKEKIENVIKFIEDYVIECPLTAGCGRCDEARQHVAALKEGLRDINQEVEKRIRERMLTDEDIIDFALLYVSHKDLKAANKGLIKDAIIIGMKQLRSRLTYSEKPNNSEQQLWRYIQERET